MRQVEGPNATVRLELRGDDGKVIAVVYLQMTTDEYRAHTGMWSVGTPEYGDRTNLTKVIAYVEWIGTE